MIVRLIDWCLHNRLIVVMLTACLVAAGVWAGRHITVDAIPDLSDVQVVIRTEYPGQAPQVVEDQVTYPLTTAMQAVPRAEAVRGFSMFGTSFVYLIFEDGTDLYWARSRVLERLATVGASLPATADPQLGPDATGVGWIYQYALVTAPYCPEHPEGLWHDLQNDQWYAPEAAPADTDALVHRRIFHDRDTCPLDGTPLAQPEQSLADLRSMQDWHLRYELTAVEGVSEVASIGGFVKQYQITVDPVRLRAYGVTLDEVRRAVQRSNQDAGGRLLELGETEYMIRGRGYLGTPDGRPNDPQDTTLPLTNSPADLDAHTRRVLEQLRQVALGVGSGGVPIQLDDVANVSLGPELRRGILEWNGQGETAGGIVVMRFGENALATIDRVRDRLAELERGLPPGVEIEVGYDRSDLIHRSLDTLRESLIKEIAVVALVVVVFLLHARSAFVALFVLPAGVLASLLTMHLLGINANIMSLGGIALAVGVMVDSSIVMVENAHVKLEHARAKGPITSAEHFEAIRSAAIEVGPSLFFSLLVITVSFLPVFVLGEQSGRMFKPLAYTKTFAMAAAAVLAVTITPVLMVYFVRERVIPRRIRWGWRLTAYALGIVVPAIALLWLPLGDLSAWRGWLAVGWAVLAAVLLLPQPMLSEERNPLSRLLEAIYNPAFEAALRLWPLTLAAMAAMVLITVYPATKLGSEFMPPLEEGDLLYMPTTIEPSISATKARELLQQTDKLIMQFPEVEAVWGKIGRAETATDPAPMNMIETTITLHRDPARWRSRRIERFYSDWPAALAWLPRQVWPDIRRITTDELVYGYPGPAGVHVPGMNDALRLPGLANSWTMPIKTRIDMLSTGIKTPLGIKVLGPELATLTELSSQIAQTLRSDPRTAAYTASAYSDRDVGGNYIVPTPDRQAIARYGLTIADVQETIASALGGDNVTLTIEGLARYPVNVRYPTELRDDLTALRQVLVATPGGAQVPLGQLASFEIESGPSMIKSEAARPTSWVYVDIKGLDLGSYIERARAVVADGIDLPPRYSLAWSGQFEYMQAARAKLSVAIPLTLVAIVLLLYLATRSWARVLLIFSTLSLSIVGAVWFVYLLDYNLSLAVVVGFIALLGLDAETSLIILLYLDTSYDRAVAEGRMRNMDDLRRAVHDGAVKRIRPKTMTVLTTIVGLVPLMFVSGAGADTMRRLAAPMIGGLITSTLSELLLYPVVFYLGKRVVMMWRERAATSALPAEVSGT